VAGTLTQRHGDLLGTAGQRVESAFALRNGQAMESFDNAALRDCEAALDKFCC
jgi:hypothetical protein